MELTWGTARWLVPRDPDPLERLTNASRPAWLRLARRFGQALMTSCGVTLATGLAVSPLAAARDRPASPVGLLLGPGRSGRGPRRLHDWDKPGQCAGRRSRTSPGRPAASGSSGRPSPERTPPRPVVQRIRPRADLDEPPRVDDGVRPQDEATEHLHTGVAQTAFSGPARDPAQDAVGWRDRVGLGRGLGGDGSAPGAIVAARSGGCRRLGPIGLVADGVFRVSVGGVPTTRPATA
jgi:hypothetical protein